MNDFSITNKGQDVPDPWYGPEPGYHEVYKLIDQITDRIIGKYSNKVNA